MKKFLLKLLGDSFIKTIAVEMSNRIITLFFMWLLGKLHDRFGNKLWYAELSNYLLGIQVADFFTDRKEVINVECEKCL